MTLPEYTISDASPCHVPIMRVSITQKLKIIKYEIYSIYNLFFFGLKKKLEITSDVLK